MHHCHHHCHHHAGRRHDHRHIQNILQHHHIEMFDRNLIKWCVSVFVCVRKCVCVSSTWSFIITMSLFAQLMVNVLACAIAFLIHASMSVL